MQDGQDICVIRSALKEPLVMIVSIPTTARTYLPVIKEQENATDGGCTPGYINSNCSISEYYGQIYILKEYKTVSYGQEYNISERTTEN